MPPLDGIRVLDMAPLGPGPHCAQILADLGAEIIRVEAPEPSEGPRAGRTIKLPADASIRRNARAIGLNLKTAAGQEVFRKLVSSTDVVIEGFRPSVVRRLGVDYESVRAINPDIVYASLSGYGQEGPYSSFVGHDINYQAVAGILAMTGRRDGPPVIPGNTIADNAGGGMNAAIGILAALLGRERGACAGYVDMAMVDGLVTMMFLTIDDYLATGHVPRRGETLLTGKYPWYNIYETKDGRYLSVGAIEPWFYENLCRCLGRDEFIGDQYADDDKQHEIFAAFRETFLTRTRDEWAAELMPADTCVAPVLEIDEVARDAHLRHRGLVVETGGAHGPRQQVGAMVKLNERPGSGRRPPSGGGDATVAILQELGYDEASIDRLRAAGAIA